MKNFIRKINKKVLIITLLLLAALEIFVVQAYLTDNEKHHNTVLTGRNVIEVKETFTPPTPGSTNPFTKDVAVKNTGDIDCFVRVYLSFSNGVVAEEAQVSTDGTTFYPFSELKNHLPADWVYIGGGLLDGYYYYTKPIKSGESTSSLTKKFKTNTSDAYDINVYAESVQLYDKNGRLLTGNNAYRDAWTEFLENKPA